MRSTQQALRVSSTQTLSHPRLSSNWVEPLETTPVDSITLHQPTLLVQCDVSSNQLCPGLEQTWLASLVHSSPDLIGTVSFDGQWLFMNQAGQALLGLHGLGSSHRLTLAQTVDETDRDRLADLLSTALQHGHWQGHLRFQQAEIGTAISTSCQWFVVRDLTHNQPLCFATIAQPITELETALPEDTVALCSAASEVQEDLIHEKTLTQLRSRFWADVSHELRSPLTVIASSSQILETMSERLDSAKKQKHFQRIQNKISQMTQLIDDILLLSRIEHRLPPQPVLTDIVQFCTELIEEVQLTTPHKIIFLPRAQEQFCVQQFNAEVDTILLQRILINLISNSVKYSPNGNEITVNLECQPETLIFRIQDHGIGIPLEEQQDLFNSFYRASNTKEIAGTGLGLATVKRCVEICGGSISLVSAVGVGTTFTVKIPIHQINTTE